VLLFVRIFTKVQQGLHLETYPLQFWFKQVQAPSMAMGEGWAGHPECILYPIGIFNCRAACRTTFFAAATPKCPGAAPADKIVGAAGMYCEHARKQPLLVLLLLQCLEANDINDMCPSPLTLCYTSYPTIPNINQCSQLHYASVASAESNRLAAAAAAAAAASRLPAHSTSLCLLPHNELLEAGRFAGAVTQVVQLGTTDLDRR
jgi:hypothetical protein